MGPVQPPIVRDYVCQRVNDNQSGGRKDVFLVRGYGELQLFVEPFEFGPFTPGGKYRITVEELTVKDDSCTAAAGPPEGEEEELHNERNVP